MIIAEELRKEFIRQEKKRKKNIKTKIRAVDGVSFTAHDGETLGILGPNGAGKTTLLRMLGSIMEPDSGSIRRYDAAGALITDPVAARRRMGYLSNNTKLNDKFTLREYLEMTGSIYLMTKEQIAARISEVEKILSLESFLDNRIARLSTGQTQRASLARCLFHEPDVYILDEPTLGLDIMSASDVISFMNAEKQRGKTIIYSTHYLEEAETLCDRVLLMNRGRIAAEGSPAELMEQENASSLREAFLSVIGKDGGTDER